MEKNRDLSIDYIKGILIFLVVWGHLIEFSLVDHSAIYYDTLRKAVYSFHMPLFVFISGWFFSSKSSFINLIKKQFGRLLLPQVSFVILGLIIYTCFWNVYSYKLTENEIFSIKKFYHFVTFAWYLWCIFFCSVIVDVCKRFFKEKSNYVLFFICVAMWLLVDWLPGPVFHNQQVARMLPCFCLGMLTKRYEACFNKNKRIFAVVCVPICILYFFLFILNTEKELPGYVIRIPLQLFTMYLAFLFLKKMFEWNILRKFFLFWSKDTLFIYVFHIFVIGLLGPLQLVFSFGSKVADYVFYAFIALIICFVVGILSHIIRKNNLTKKFLLGEK